MSRGKVRKRLDDRDGQLPFDPEVAGAEAPSDRGETREGGIVLPPTDANEFFHLVRASGLRAKATILDPWYNKGVGGVRDDYKAYIVGLIADAASVSDHIFLWGFPEIVAGFVERLPEPLTLTAWLTWYYKNNPSVIKGWRSSQMACLHISQPGARLYPEHFLNPAQLRLLAEGKLRYMPGPTSVIEEPLLVGFVGRGEQTGHPAQKPVAVFRRLIEMTTCEKDLVLDPMCGSGTTGVACRELNRNFILNDHNNDYVKITENRLKLCRNIVKNIDVSFTIPRV